jgi:hypothetical protein
LPLEPSALAGVPGIYRLQPLSPVTRSLNDCKSSSIHNPAVSLATFASGSICHHLHEMHRPQDIFDFSLMLRLDEFTMRVFHVRVHLNAKSVPHTPRARVETRVAHGRSHCLPTEILECDFRSAKVRVTRLLTTLLRNEKLAVSLDDLEPETECIPFWTGISYSGFCRRRSSREGLPKASLLLRRSLWAFSSDDDTVHRSAWSTDVF